MPGSQVVQETPTEQVETLRPYFTGADQFTYDLARLEAALHWPLPNGPCRIKHTWKAGNLRISGYHTDATMTANNIGTNNYYVTPRGAPYIDFLGVNQYLNVAQGNYSDVWMEAYGAVWWGWVQIDDWGVGPNLNVGWAVWAGTGSRQFRIVTYDPVPTGVGDFAVIYSHDGTNGNALYWIMDAGGNPTPPSATTWIFFCMYIVTPTIANGFRAYFGTAAQETLDIATAQSQAAVWDAGTADLTIGAQHGGGYPADWRISILKQAVNFNPNETTFALIDDYVYRVYNLTRPFYM